MERFSAMAGSILLHLLLVGFLFLATREEAPPPQAALVPIIQARAVDEATALEPVRRREAAEEAKRQAEAERRRAEAERKKAEQEKKLKAEQEQKQKLKAEQEKQLKTEQEKKQKLKAEQEKKLKAEQEKKLKAEQEKKLKAEQEQKLKAEEERKRKEAEDKLKQDLAAEQERLRAEEQRLGAQRRAGMVNQYVSAITSKVTGNWLRQPGMPQQFSCKVWVRQTPGGEVVDVRIIESSGNPLLDRSVEAAVWKSSPLPPPPSPEVFDREVVITFVPQ